APLRYIARAITPPRFPIRYDTRFFLGTLANSQLPARIASGDGELVSPDWYNQAALVGEPLHHVTQTVLDHAVQVTLGLSDVMTRLLVADRRPKRWDGEPPLRSAALKANQSAQSAVRS
ncbi:MAG: hypothetical protein AB8B88_03990, partial [Devosiaceae bacterium]